MAHPECENCDGSGDCPDCEGAGYLDEHCEICCDPCDGSGVCNECNGSGNEGGGDG